AASARWCSIHTKNLWWLPGVIETIAWIRLPAEVCGTRKVPRYWSAVMARESHFNARPAISMFFRCCARLDLEACVPHADRCHHSWVQQFPLIADGSRLRTLPVGIFGH